MPFTLAHLSDPHLGPLPRPRLQQLMSKRAFGYLNWHFGRQRAYSSHVLDAMVEDIAAVAPDHIALTGDLVNIALRHEYMAGLHFLEKLGPPDKVSLVPGNHDAYVRSGVRHLASFWPEYMRGDDGQDGFPYLRQRGGIVLIGVSSAVPTAPLMATGRIGHEQMSRLEVLLEAAGRQGLCRIVMLHHPLHKTARFKRLTDAGALRKVLSNTGAELVLHGHEHRASLLYLDGVIPVVGVPCASSHGPHGQSAGWAKISIDHVNGRWQVKVLRRSWSRSAQAFVTEETDT